MAGHPGELDFPSPELHLRMLGNGVEILVKEDHAAPVVSLQAWCRSGSIHEGPWLGAGLSHFLEHMLFKGTGRRHATDVAREVQREGGYINAYTSFDRTVYWIDAPASGALACLDILCDVAGFATLPREEFEKEREVIRREIAMGEDSPDQVASKRLFRTAYAIHPCRYPIIGELDLFNQLERDDLHRYYDEKYAPGGTFFVVAGDVEADEVCAHIESLWGEKAMRPGGAPVLPEEPRQAGRRADETSFPTELTRLRFAWPLVDGTHADVPALDLLATVLGQGRSSRLVREVRDRRGLAHRISAWSYTPSFRGLFAVNIDTEPGKAEEAERAAFGEIERIASEGITEEELAKAKAQALSAQFSTLTDVRGQASDLGSNWLLARNPDLTGEYVREVQAVTAPQVAAAAGAYLAGNALTRVALHPQDAPPAPATRSTPRRSDDIRRIELTDGLTVLLLADRRVPFVQATGVFRGGLLAESEKTAGITRLTGRLFAKDTRFRSADDVAGQIEAAGGGISGSFGNNTFGASVGALRPGLELSVELLRDALLYPAFLEDTVRTEKEFQAAAIKAENDRPVQVAMKRLRRELYGDHPYGLPASGTGESLATLQASDLATFRERLVVGGNGVVGVFGDLDLDRTEDLVREAFAETLPAGDRLFTGGSGDSLTGDLGRVVEITHAKEQAILLVGFRTVDLLHADNTALEMIDEACSDMASRVFIRIREELGLAYSVGATRLNGIDPGCLVFYVATDPAKLDLVQDNLLDEIDAMAREGLEEEELERARASWLGRDAIHLQGAKELAETATIDEVVGLGWDNYRRTPDLIRRISHGEIAEVAARYLREDNRIIVRLTRET